MKQGPTLKGSRLLRGVATLVSYERGGATFSQRSTRASKQPSDPPFELARDPLGGNGICFQLRDASSCPVRLKS